MKNKKAAKKAAPKNIDVEIRENKNFRSVLLPESFGSVNAALHLRHSKTEILQSPQYQRSRNDSADH